MSNFSTLALITEGNTSTAPSTFSASTPDSYATLSAPGYLNDIAHKIKANDLILVNYLDQSVFPLDTGESSLLTELKVAYNPGTQAWSLVPANLNQNGAALLAALGFHSATAVSTTTSATSVYSDPLVSAAAIAFARWPVAATAGNIEKVTPSSGNLTILNSSTAGASTIAYFTIIGSMALQNLGVYTNQYTNAGGSATITITDPLITASQIVVANFASSANAVKVQKVTPTAGTLTVICSGDPGASVLSYLAVTPSTALVNDGCYAATAASAGGSATVTITDANITENSVVMADMSAYTNASYIEKVTPSASTLTILLNTDAGAATFNYIATVAAEGNDPSGYLLASNNLSDVANAGTSRTNLGVGAAQSVTFGQVIVGVTNITAGTTQTQAGATPITSSIVVVTTGNAGDGVILPALSTALIGSRVQLINASASAGVVYCPGATNTNTINGTAGATGVAYAASKTLFLVAVSATAWVSTLSN